MKRLLIVSALVLCGAVDAPAVQVYRDLIRPHGQPRSEAVHEADLNLCYARTGADRTRPDTAAFKKCMRTRGYRYIGVQRERVPVERTWIDPETGLTCKDLKDASGTVYGSRCSNMF